MELIILAIYFIPQHNHTAALTAEHIHTGRVSIFGQNGHHGSIGLRLASIQ
jgi:hypothetical protein